MLTRISKFWFLLLLLAPLSAFADVVSLPGFFTPEPGDLSITYLGQLFGSVGGVLAGTGGQMLGQLFGIMNNGIVIVMCGFFTYSIFTFVVNTAAEGEFMGRGTSTAMVALRTVSGLSLAIPSKASGYCLAQTIVMWAVVQGVGLADRAWERAVAYIADEGGSLYISSPLVDNLIPLVNPAQQILQSEVCMYKLKDIMQGNSQGSNASNPNASASANNNSPNLGIGPTQQPQQGNYLVNNTPTDPNSSGGQVGYSFNQDSQNVTFGILNSASQSQDYGDQCGSVSWAGANDRSITNYDGQVVGSYREIALRQMVLDLLPIAQAIENTTDTNTNPNTPSNVTDLQALKEQIVGGIVTAVVDYGNIIHPAMTKVMDNGKDKARKALEDSIDKGWIMAGSYYRDLSNVNNKLNQDISAFVPAPSPPNLSTSIGITSEQITQIENTMDIVGQNTPAVTLALNQIQSNLSQGKSGLGSGALTALKASVMTTGAVLSGSGLVAGSPFTTHFSAIIAASTAAVTTFIYRWDQTVNKAGDPILKLQQLGQSMVEISVGLWLTITGLIFFVPMPSRAFSSISPIATSISDATRWFTPLISAIMLSMFASGIMLSTYLPLIPYFVYTFASIGWLIAVLEAMAAAPLVALGLTHPEGQNFLGKAEQGIMLLFSVFLRPILLLIGLVAALILAQVCVRLINAGFSVVVSTTDIAAQKFTIFSTIALMIIYTTFQILVINYLCNAVIPGVATNVMGWLGIPAKGDSFESQLSTLQGSTQEPAQMGGKQAWSGVEDPSKPLAQKEGGKKSDSKPPSP